MELKCSQTINNISSSDMYTMMSLIDKHTNKNADTVEWMNPLDFSAKDNSYDNPKWDESMNGPHK